MSDEQIELVGGPNDGKMVPDCGPTFREPVRRGPVAMYIPVVPAEIAHLDTIPESSFYVREYRKWHRPHRGCFVYLLCDK